MRLGIRTVVHASGERVALLFSEQPYQPILTPLLWVTLARRSCSYRTILQDVQALKAVRDGDFMALVEEIAPSLLNRIVQEA